MTPKETIHMLSVNARASLILLAIAGLTQAQITHSFTEPYDQSDVAAAEPGVVAKIVIQEGQRVQKGDVLAELDRQVLAESLRLAKLKAASTARMESSAAILKMRTKQRDNILPLFKSGHANPAEVEMALAQFEAARSEHRRMQEEAEQFKIEVDRIRAQLERRTIRSPIDGIGTEVHKRPGEYIASVEPMFATVCKLVGCEFSFYLILKRIPVASSWATLSLEPRLRN